jgi:signal transduction histidine kinase
MTIAICFSMALYNVSSHEINAGFQREFGIVRHFPTIYDDLPSTFADARQRAIDESNTHLRTNLIFYNVIILVAGGAASYWFARRTLLPIKNALESQSRFTADASHELRTPLTAMRSEIEVAQRDKNLTLAEAQQLLASNLEEIEKIETLSSNLLKLAHYDEGSAVAEFTPIELAPIIEKSLRAAAKLAKHRGMKLERALGPVSLEADAKSLQELLMILLDNATKYSKKGGRVEVRCAQIAHEAIISVQDSGIGIDEKEIPHLFERFYRADSSRTKAQVNGYGLGLSIAKSIVDAHHGSIEVASKLGEGTTFRITLPLAQPNSPHLV